jgi:hypothetical protein
MTTTVIFTFKYWSYVFSEHRLAGMGVIADRAKATGKAISTQTVFVKGVEASVAVMVALGLILFLTGTFPVHHQGKAEPKLPANGPAEFLYLDGSRVLAYLAQFDGGNFTTKQLTSKVSETANAAVSVKDAFELGESSQQEQSVSTQITATAAGNSIELLAKLNELHSIQTIGLGRFNHEVHGLTEGQFVTFRTHALRSPVYLNPYLAVRQRKTLSTLFPMPPKGVPGRNLVLSQRAGARRFRQEVGEDPRVVFELHPVNSKEREEREADLTGGTEAAKQVSLSAKEEAAIARHEEAEHVEYLMPMDAQLISEERSLIKFGGGEFTVVGKVERVFPEPGDDHSPAYVDSPTLETWERPLANAPAKLLCRTDPRCMMIVRARDVTQERQEKAIRDSRAWAKEALEEQTEIPRRGAVIVPIAIYK